MTWEMIRVTGMVAMGLLTVSVTLGILGPAIRRPAARLTSVSMHLTAAVGGTILVIAHVFLAVIDGWIDISAKAAFIPGVSAWEPLWIAVGTVAFDLLLVMAVTSAMRQQAPRLWWNAHVIAYPVWALVWIHAVAIGTDAGTKWMIAGAAVSAAMVAAATVIRVMRPVRTPVGTTYSPEMEEVMA